jgi:intracellular sulfur oxidation DsrE/DsrF family protein
MKLTAAAKDKIHAFLSELNVEHLDVVYHVDINEIDLENAYDSIYKMIEESDAFNVEIIYYSRAIEYLSENDLSLKRSLNIAAELCYTPENLNSETLASLLASQITREKFYELEDEINSFFEEMVCEFEEEEQDRFLDWLESDNVVKSGENEYKTQCTQYKKVFDYDELLEYFINEYIN